MCLVINKLDRLILELNLSPAEAYTRISAIVGHMNMILSSFESEKYISEADSILAYETMIANQDEGGQLDESSEEDYFCPDKGNVAFGSAHDGWAFTVQQFAELYAKKLECKKEPLYKAMWGNYMFSPKTRRVVPIKPGSNGTPLFVQWILDPIWKIYEACRPGFNHAEILEKAVEKLHIIDKKVAGHQDPRVALRGVMRSWLPLSTAILGMGTAFLPNPRQAAPNRVSRLLPKESKGTDVSLNERLDSVQNAISSCNTSEDAPLVVYVSKMISVPRSTIPRRHGEVSSFSSSEEVFLAFGRVFSGIIREGQTVMVLQADYNPYHPSEDGKSASLTTISDVYLMMGRGLERLHSVPAGNILALAGLETSILKSATISSTMECRPLAPLTFQAMPIVQVAVEPAHPGDMDALERGLQLLHRADPLVQVSLQESGEHVISAAGEVHLETCIKDLRERFARIDIVVSAPLVSFRESISSETDETKVIEASTASKACIIRVKTRPIPENLTAEIDRLDEEIKSIASGKTDLTRGANKESMNSIASLTEHVSSMDKTVAIPGASKKIWMLGPKRIGPNMLLSSTKTPSLWDVEKSTVVLVSRIGHHLMVGQETNEGTDSQFVPEGTDDFVEVPIPLGTPIISKNLGIIDDFCMDELSEESIKAQLLQFGLHENEDYDQPALRTILSTIHSTTSGVATGFQISASAGPLCDEPLWGICIELEAKLCLKRNPDTGLLTVALQEDVFGPFNGQVSAAVKHAIRKSILENKPRLVEAYFLCEVATSSEGLAAVYAVLGRRRAKILQEELREGSGLFVILAHLPVEASFGFADELRRRSSGNASASLMLSHWEKLPMDPFFQPHTEEEREEFGEEGQGFGAPNLSKRLIDAVRRRKGLQVEEKVVESATKQRTRAKKV